MDSLITGANSTENQHSPSQPMPWLNSKGQMLSDKKLKEISPRWDQDTWEKYLNYLDGTLSEQQFHPNAYEDMSEKMEKSCWELTQSDADRDSKSLVNSLFRELSTHQRKILKMIFWEGRSERFVARELKLSRSTIKVIKRRALKRLNALLRSEVSPISPLMRGKDFSNATGGADAKTKTAAQNQLQKVG